MEGRIISVLGGLYTIKDLNDNNYYQAKARGNLRHVKLDKKSSFHKEKVKENMIVKLSPKVGDIVTFSLSSDQYVIEDIKPRFNDLIRPLVSNVDQMILIFAVKEPDLDLYLLDQFLVMMEKNNVKCKIVFTKIDLLSDEELKHLLDIKKYYDGIGYECFLISNKTKSGIEELERVFDHRLSILSGQTGAGKSNSINSLIPGFNLKTNEISQALGRGKHTTRQTELFEFKGGLIGDTPGFSKIDLLHIDYNYLKDYFVEFEVNQCKFQDCKHLSEPGCKIKEDVENGKILKSRYVNYVKFYQELFSNKKY